MVEHGSNRYHIKVSTSAGTIAGSWSFDTLGGSTKAVFTPLNPLPGDKRIDVQLYTLRDQVGNYNSYRFSFDTAAGEDTTPPQIVSITPADDSMDIAPTSSVVLTFSESLASNTVNNNNFMLYADGAIIKPNVYRSADNRTVTLRGNWPQGSAVSVIVSDAVVDLSGNALDDYISLFTTGVADEFDNDRPTIMRQYPTTGATGVNMDTEIVLYTSESMNPDSVRDGFRVAENGVLIDGSLEIAGNNRFIRFTPVQPFASDALVHIYLDSTATDSAGNALNNYQSNFRVASTEIVGVRPRPIAYSLFNNQADVPLNPLIQVAYNQALDIGTVNEGTVTLYHPDKTTVAVTISLINGLNDNSVIQIQPEQPLIADTRYHLYLGSIADTDGDYSYSKNLYFNTSVNAVEDHQPPQMLSISPPDGATGVPLRPRYHMRFDEAINPVAFAKGIGDKALDMNIQFAADNREVLYSYYQPLASDSDITETVPTVMDIAGNPIDISTSFRTGNDLDLSEPRVVKRIPEINSTVATNTRVQAQMSEAIDPLTVTDSNFYVLDYSDGQTLVPGTVSLSADGRTLVWVPEAGSKLVVGRRYMVRGWGISDLSGNSTNLSTNLYWYFYTSLIEDTVAPQVLATTVFDGQGNVPTNARIRVRFNEAIDVLGLEAVQLAIDGTAIAVNRSISDDRHYLTLKPKQLLPANRLITLTIAGIKDVSGNLLEQSQTISFTTGDVVDTQASSLERVTPFNNADNVPLNAVIEFRFSERIDATTITSDAIFLYNRTEGRKVATDLTVDEEGRHIRLIPQELLEAGHDYLVPFRYSPYVGWLPYLTDLAGNPLSSTSIEFTAGKHSQTQTPQIIGHNLSQGTDAVAMNAPLVIWLDKPLNHLCTNRDTVTVDNGSSTITGTISLSDDRRQLTFDPVNNLAANTDYTLTLSGVCDLTGQTLADYSLDFSTGDVVDTTGPNIHSRQPARSTGVEVNSAISITFNELLDIERFKDMVEDGSYINVYTSAGTIAGSWSFDTLGGGTRAVFTPLNPLPGYNRIYIQLNYLRDQVGNYNSYSFSFDTAAGEDTT